MEHPPDLSQPGCLLEGLTHLLSFVEGDFAVVLHSEADCANLVFRDRRVCDPRRFLCTRLSEREAVMGEGEIKLRAALREAARRCPAGPIYVVSGCVASMVGEDLQRICKRSAINRKRLSLWPGSAFGKVGQAELIDRYCRSRIEANLPARKGARKKLALLGFPPDDGECERFLKSRGAELLCRLGPTSSFDEWEKLKEGPLLVVSDQALFARSLSVWKAEGGKALCVPVPLGIRRSEDFYRAVFAAVSLQGADAELRSAAERTRRVLASLRRRRVRLAYHVGSRKNFDLPSLLEGGLMALSFFGELGFRCALFFQGAVEEERRREIRRLLDYYGWQLPFDCLPDRLSLARALRTGGFDLVYCDASLAEQAGQAAMPFLEPQDLRYGFSGAQQSYRRLQELLGG